MKNDITSDHTKNNTLFLVYLAGLSIIGFLATDMYLPAFDKMRIALNTTKSNIGATMSLFLAGYAIAQLLWGPISDKIGKPKTVLIGLSIFTAASLGIYFTQSVTVLLLLRLVQAIGVCASAVCWQALVVERYPKEETNRIFATIMPLVALSPALAPVAGAFLLDYFGWRSIFIALALITVLLILYTLTIKEEKTSDTKNDKLSNPTSEKTYTSLLKSKKYIGNVLIYALCSAAFFAWLTGSPFFLKELGYNENQIGLSFFPQTIAFLIGGYGYRSLGSKVETKKLLPILLLAYSISMVSLYLITILITPTLTILLIPFCLMALVNGACYPIVVAEAMKTFPNNSGKAAALQNTIQLGICFLASAIVSLFSKEALLTTTIVMICTIPFVYVGYRLSLKK
ncbi:Bcr/CflA family multidrug efflux MFS transporter [Pedobacter sp. HMWF019]|uniref:purine nucleoside transporter PunC n=1 Tax=Pedobacter sp. HMWF019 TaxID=2056856 RepID=UPI000D37C257|nr:purine nucleoside transporter PunC [Pedobacter sp. HMWF019]PTS99297.1 Bcr/CflA family multidrug efflux MFS transporter [Pedobacter sp. HMWF019]